MCNLHINPKHFLAFEFTSIILYFDGGNFLVTYNYTLAKKYLSLGIP